MWIIGPSGAPRSFVIELDPTAHVFRPGHRIRVHIAAGAHPRLIDQRGGRYRVDVDASVYGAPTLTLPEALPGS